MIATWGQNWRKEEKWCDHAAISVGLSHEKKKKNYKDTIKIKIEAKELSFTQKLNKLKQRVLCKGRQTCRAATKKKMLCLREK